MHPSVPIEELLSDSGWLRSLAASLVGDPALADDLVQDAWLAAQRHPPRAGEERPWFARVVANLARNARRGRARRAAREELAHGMSAAQRVQATPAELAQAAEAQRLLAEAVTRLPEGQRAVIVLCYFQGLDSNAAGARLGLSPSAVRTRLQAALAALRADLDRSTAGGRAAWAGMLAGLARKGAEPAAFVAATSALSGPIALALAASVAALALAVVFATRAERDEAAAERVELAASDVEARGDAKEPARASGDAPVLESGARAALPTVEELRPGPGAASAPAAGPALETAKISGVLRVDGRPPEWPLALRLAPPLPPPDASGQRARVRPIELALAPEAGGVFAFEDLPVGWSGTLRVEHHVFADGASELALHAPRTDLALELRAGPAIVGRILAPDGRPAADLRATCELRYGHPVNEGNMTASAGADCRADGRFRIPLRTWDGWCELTLRVEAPGVGFLHQAPARFDPRVGLDLGELVLEPCRVLAFRVRDPRGRPLAGVFARVDGAAWSFASAPTDAEGRGTLGFVPERPVALRFGALRHADRVVTVAGESELEVELEPLATLELRLTGARAGEAEDVLVTAPRAAFVQDETGWGRTSGVRVGSGDGTPFLRSTGAPGEPLSYAFKPSAAGTLTLVGLVPGVPLTLEVRSLELRVLAVSTHTAAPMEWATLEIAVP